MFGLFVLLVLHLHGAAGVALAPQPTEGESVIEDEAPSPRDQLIMNFPMRDVGSDPLNAGPLNPVSQQEELLVGGPGKEAMNHDKVGLSGETPKEGSNRVVNNPFVVYGGDPKLEPIAMNSSIANGNEVWKAGNAAGNNNYWQDRGSMTNNQADDPKRVARSMKPTMVVMPESKRGAAVARSTFRYHARQNVPTELRSVPIVDAPMPETDGPENLVEPSGNFSKPFSSPRDALSVPLVDQMSELAPAMDGVNCPKMGIAENLMSEPPESYIKNEFSQKIDSDAA